MKSYKEALLAMLQDTEWRNIRDVCGLLRCSRVPDCENCPFMTEGTMDEFIDILELEVKHEAQSQQAMFSKSDA